MQFLVPDTWPLVTAGYPPRTSRTCLALRLPHRRLPRRQHDIPAFGLVLENLEKFYYLRKAEPTTNTYYVGLTSCENIFKLVHKVLKNNLLDLH